MLSRALAAASTINDIRYMGDAGRVALYKKYDYKNNFQSRNKVDEEGKRCAQYFSKTLKAIETLEKSKVSKKIDHRPIGVLGGINSYLQDVKPQVLEKLAAAASVIEKDAKPEEVRKAAEGLKWFVKLVEERTEDDKRLYERISSKVNMVPSL